MQSVEIRYHLSHEQFKAAVSLHWEKHGMSPTRSLVEGSLGVIIGVALSYAIGWMGLVAAGLSSFLLLITLIRSYRWGRVYHDSGKYRDEIVVRFSSEGLHVSSVAGTSDLSWSFFKQFTEGPDFLLLYADGRTSRLFPSIIPKVAFTEPEGLKEVVVFLESELKRFGEKPTS